MIQSGHKQNQSAASHLALWLISFRARYLKRSVLGIAFVLISYSLNAAPVSYPKSITPEKMLEHLLSGEYKKGLNAVEWHATPGDIHEFNGQFGDNQTLYTIVDTTFILLRGDEKVYYTIFRTAPMIRHEEGEFVNASNCHACGVNLGYFSYTIENDSLHVTKFRRNFATHGSFGAKSYNLSMVNLGEGYELLKVDDPYDGMGITSVSTKFYQDGELMLSLISKENNGGYREKNQKGYYEFNTSFTYDNNAQTINIRQTGYRIDEKSGKRIPISKAKKLSPDNYTLQF
jgi:methionine-rich copper-binding protein CopC